MKDDFTAKIVTLPEIYDACVKLAEKITDSGIKFDLVIGIARGGFPPARFICDFLNINTLASIQIKHYTKGATKGSQAELKDLLNFSIEGKNVLVIDDVNDTGKTLKAADKHLRELNPAEIKFGVLHEKDNTDFKADFAGDYLEKWQWYIYQWAVTEDVLEFLNEGDMLGESKNDMINYLNEKYKLKISEELLEKILKFKGNYFPSDSS